MAACSTFLRFLNWKMDGKWKMENGNRIHHPCVLLGSRGEVRQVGLSEESPYRTLPTSGLVGPRTDGELALSIHDRSYVAHALACTMGTRLSDLVRRAK